MSEQTVNAARALSVLAREGGVFVTLAYDRQDTSLAQHVSGEVTGIAQLPAGDGSPGDWLVSLARAGQVVNVKLSRVERIEIMGGLREARRRAEA